MASPLIKNSQNAASHAKCNDRFVIITISCVAVFMLNLIVFRMRFSEKHGIGDQNYEIEEATPAIRPLMFRKADVVILLTQCNSGSTITGEIFRRRPKVFYFYEPLHAFRELNYVPNPELLNDVTVEALDRLVRCKLHQLPSLYVAGYDTTGQRDMASCVKRPPCFNDWNCKLPYYHINACSHRCLTSEFRVMKITNLRRLELMAPMLTKWQASDNITVKVVHLVRDPRAVISSRLIKIKSKKWKQIDPKDMCLKMSENIAFAEERLHQFANKESTYMRVRYEDFVQNPIEITKKIFGFVGHNNFEPLLKEKWLMPVFDRSWQWRQRLDFRTLRIIQRRCNAVMHKLGYKSFATETEYNNFTIHFLA